MEELNILLARQPIFDRKLAVHGYELLFRPTPAAIENWDGDLATSQLLMNAFAEIGIERVSDKKAAFVNFTRNWLLSPPPFDAKFVTIEVLENVDPDEEVIAGVKAMAEAGFTIALDDFIFEKKFAPLVELASIIKIDVLQHQGQALIDLVTELKPYNVKLLAEKIEDHDVFEHCKSLGFEYFQGFFLSKPQNIHGDVLPSNKVVVMRLLAELQTPETTTDKLEQIIANDISLSTKILRICNTPQYASMTKVDSIKRALVLIGIDTLKRWSCLIALSQMTDKPNELICLTLHRAKTMELMSRSAGIEATEAYFTVGMFSLIDAFFDQPIENLLNSLPFDEQVNMALLKREGIAGKTLQALIFHERGAWDEVDWEFLNKIGIDHETFEKNYLDGLVWSTEMMQSLLD